MEPRPRKYKTIKHYHEPGDLHELTFSCYRRIALLTNNPWRETLSRSIDAACEAEQCRLVAFVYMPEHIHLLLWPQRIRRHSAGSRMASHHVLTN